MRRWIWVVLLGFLVFGCKEGPKVEEPEGGPVPVEVFKVKRERVERWIEAVGTVMPRQAVRITPKVPGKIEAIYVQEGDRVSQGEPLVKLEQKDFLLAVDRAEAAYLKAKAQLERARVALEDARRDWKRGKFLFAQKVISQREYEKLETAFKAARSRYDLAQAQLQEAEVLLRQAKKELADTVIRAPFSGYVSERFVDPGQRAYTMPPTEILELLDLSQVKVVFDLPERDLPSVKEGQPLRVFPDALPERAFSGKVTKVYPKVDPTTRTFRAEGVLDNPEGLIKPGMFVRVKVLLGEEETLLIPADAVLRLQGTGEVYCFVVEEGRAQRRELEVGRRLDSFVEVLGGLREGELVVVSGQHNLRSGNPVSVKGDGDEG
ncbi:MAG: hypothetical protein DRG31_05180 [Deltaproteobacteria bacterium]|nr:MAG: hypothetical protein DRG31_05180 [Deltaproteobacteria bacterium]